MHVLTSILGGVYNLPVSTYVLFTLKNYIKNSPYNSKIDSHKNALKIMKFRKKIWSFTQKKGGIFPIRYWFLTEVDGFITLPWLIFGHKFQNNGMVLNMSTFEKYIFCCHGEAGGELWGYFGNSQACKKLTTGYNF